MEVNLLPPSTVTTQRTRYKRILTRFSVMIGPIIKPGEAMDPNRFTRVKMIRIGWKGFENTMGRFFGEQLPIVIVGPNFRAVDRRFALRNLDNKLVIHEKYKGWHILSLLNESNSDPEEAKEELEKEKARLEILVD